MKNDSVENLLNERQQIHGDFKDNARLGMAFIRLLENEPLFKQMTLEQQYACVMITGKIARAVNGNNLEPDHWQDIIGYSTLALKSIPKSPKQE